MKVFKNEFYLENEDVILKPVEISDIEGYCEIAFDKDIWDYTTGKLCNKKDVEDYVNKGIQDRENAKRLMFTIISKKDNSIAGSSSFGNISERDRRIEIGWTWLAKKHHGKGLNSSCKKLLIDYAFDVLKAVRVEFKTDVLNKKARKALLNIGCTEEGVLRSHTLMHDGRRRDTIFYSILKSERKIK